MAGVRTPMSHKVPVEEAAKERCRFSLKHRIFSRIDTLGWSLISQMDKVKFREGKWFTKPVGRIGTRSSENSVHVLIKHRSSDC